MSLATAIVTTAMPVTAHAMTSLGNFLNPNALSEKTSVSHPITITSLIIGPGDTIVSLDVVTTVATV